MSRTKRNEPRNGQFKELRASKKRRNKKQRAGKANLTRHIKFATQHREHLDMTQLSAAKYMEDD